MIAAALLLLLAADPQPQPFLRSHSDPLLDFSYGWPAPAEEEPALRAIFTREMEAAEAQARAAAEEDREAREGSGFPFHGHSFSKVWRVAGSTPRLLSLTAENEAFTGGAHGSFAFAAMLWDRVADRQLDTAVTLDEAALDRLTPRYCDALNAERSERRGEPVTPDPEDSFTACPALANLPLAPTDKDGDGRFDTLAVLIPPYEAGSWAEGPYVVEVQFEAEDLVGLPESYRPAFEPASSASPPQTGGDETG